MKPTNPHPNSVSGRLSGEFADALAEGRGFRSTATRAPWESDAAAAPVAASVRVAEPRVSKQTFAASVGMSVRWVELRISDGMPCEYIDGRPRLRVSECEDWLRSQGHLTTTPSAGPNRG